MQILKMKGDRIPVLNMYCANQPVLICEKAVSIIFAVTDLSLKGVIFYYKDSATCENMLYIIST